MFCIIYNLLLFLLPKCCTQRNGHSKKGNIRKRNSSVLFIAIMNVPTCHEFYVLAKDVMGQRRRKTVSSVVKERRFRSLFGVPPSVCVEIVYRLVELRIINKKGAHAVHLLWTLFFMKRYNTYETNAASFNCDEKTYRKWVWVVIEGIAQLFPDIVSKDEIFFICIQYD